MARPASTALLLAAVLLPPLARADVSREVVVEKRPFVIRHSFQAAAMPVEATLLRLDAAVWTDYQITRIASHGSRVSKGDVLVAFDTRRIDEKIHDLRKALEKHAIGIAQARHDLAHLESTTPHRMDALKREAAEAREENAYFIQTRRKAAEETADQQLKRAEMALENQSEELRQLEKMYAADDLTEETEEIILKRQKDQVAAAEFDLRMAQLSHKRRREVLLPREAQTLADAERDTAIALARFTDEAPRALTRAKLELDALQTAAARDKEQLERLEADRRQFQLAAASDGWFYHGAIENGRWITGELLKELVPGGNPPLRRPFASFIPATGKLELVASLKGDVASQLAEGASGVAWIDGREDAEFAVQLTRLDPAPGPDGQHAARFNAAWPDKPAVSPASGLHISLVAHEAPAAIVLPHGALEYGPSGWTVAVKLADGKTERRPVKRGRASHEECEILTGLEAGQVVVIP